MQIVYVSDGKAGHRSQALGLYQAIHEQYPDSNFKEIKLERLSLWSLLKGLVVHHLDDFQSPPDFIVGVGSHTHFRVWLLGKIYPEARTVILMKPGLPIRCFDFAIIPEHDGIAASQQVMLTRGALNPLKNEHRHEADRILIALGGSSKRHQWNESKVLTAVAQIIKHNPHAKIILTTSRRTPADFLARLQQQTYASQLQVFPVEDTPQGWIFEQMQRAQGVWVTEDSVSMIFEALTAGCGVGIIEMDRLKADRITGAVDRLLQQHLVSRQTRLSGLVVQHAFKEAERVATYLLNSRLSR